MSELGLFHHPTLAATQAALSACAEPQGGPMVAALVNSLQRFSREHHGDFERWQAALGDLPEVTATNTGSGTCVTIEGDCSTLQQTQLQSALEQFRPWRKGPFSLFDLHIDTEWRSDWKWQRLAPLFANHPALIANARVLDVGCGNGYFGWQLLRAGAASVIGVDPTLLFCMQHLAINRYLQDDRNWVLPLRLEELPDIGADDRGFDGVLSMGVLYHRRDPREHIQQLFDLVAPGGWLIMETLVVDGTESIFPANDGGRYARMRNVWCVPNVTTVQNWLEQCGFRGAQLLDCTTTSVEEQRATAWMTFESLEQALDPKDSAKTVEGWPRPQRAMLLATRPDR